MIAEIQFNSFMVFRLMKPKHYKRTFLGFLKNQVIDSTVCLLASYKAITRRYVAIAHIETITQVLAFAYVFWAAVHENYIYTAKIIIVRYFKLTKWPLSIIIKR